LIRTLGFLLAAATFGAAAARAQSGWTLEAAAGGAVHDPLAANVGSTTTSLGLAYDGGDRWAYTAAGLPLSGEGPRWGTIGLGRAWSRPLRGLEAGVVASADAFAYGGEDDSHGYGVSARVMPGLALTRGPWRAELAAGGAAQTATQQDSTARRGVAEAFGQLTWAEREGLRVSGVLRYVLAEEGSLPYLGASAELRRERASVWAEAGGWVSDLYPGPRAALGAGAELRVERRTTLAFSWRQEPTEPLFGNPPRRSWNLLVRRALGGAPTAAGARRDPVARVNGGTVTFRLRRSQHPVPPALISDLTSWQPVSLRAEGEQWWSLTMPVTRGVHRYAFRTPQGGSWLPPDEPRESDGFGGYNAVLVVP
jgi:hypothetical protein